MLYASREPAFERPYGTHTRIVFAHDEHEVWGRIYSLSTTSSGFVDPMHDRAHVCYKWYNMCCKTRCDAHLEIPGTLMWEGGDKAVRVMA